eukprot:scaffold25674_cov42-Prasinocladus_malaysianus.AAC.1
MPWPQHGQGIRPDAAHLLEHPRREHAAHLRHVHVCHALAARLEVLGELHALHGALEELG